MDISSFQINSKKYNNVRLITLIKKNVTNQLLLKKSLANDYEIYNIYVHSIPRYVSRGDYDAIDHSVSIESIHIAHIHLHNRIEIGHLS